MSAQPVPPPDGLHRALREAQRRRLQRAGLGSTVTVLGSAVLLALAGSGGPDVLGQEPVPDLGRGNGIVELVPASPRPTPDGTDRTLAAASPAVPRPTTTAATATSPVDGPPATQPRPAGPAPSTDRMDREGPVYIVSPRTTCTVGERTLCSGVDVAPADDGFTVRAHLCSHGPSPVRLRFPDGLEVDLLVGPPGAPDWRWSDGRRVAGGPHELRLEQGQCWQWTTTYDGRTGDGGRLPSGNHRMTAVFGAEDLGGAAEAATEFSMQR